MGSRIIDLNGLLKKTSGDGRSALLRENINLFIAEILEIDEDELSDNDMSFGDIGLDSISALKLKDMINKAFSGAIALETTDVFDKPSVNQLCEHIENLLND